MSKDTRLVYSTEQGRIKTQDVQPSAPSGDGIVRLRYETKGRNGKGVTTVTGISVVQASLKDLAKQLKQRCGTGGSIKEGVIEIQGDHRQTIKAFLEGKKYQVKLAGG